MMMALRWTWSLMYGQFDQVVEHGRDDRYGRLYNRVGIEFIGLAVGASRVPGRPDLDETDDTIGFDWAKGEGGAGVFKEASREASPIIIVSNTH